LIIKCEKCGKVLGDMRSDNVFDDMTGKNVEVEMTGKVFARRQLVSFSCPYCGHKTEVLEVLYE